LGRLRALGCLGRFRALGSLGCLRRLGLFPQTTQNKQHQNARRNTAISNNVFQSKSRIVGDWRSKYEHNSPFGRLCRLGPLPITGVAMFGAFEGFGMFGTCSSLGSLGVFETLGTLSPPCLVIHSVPLGSLGPLGCLGSYTFGTFGDIRSFLWDAWDAWDLWEL
jgi:hypothetical protein